MLVIGELDDGREQVFNLMQLSSYLKKFFFIPSLTLGNSFVGLKRVNLVFSNTE